MPSMRVIGGDQLWQRWLAKSPCPGTGPEDPCINLWVAKAARYCYNSKLISAERACDFIRGAMTRREKVAYEVSRTVERIYDESVARSIMATADKTALYDSDKLQRLASHVPFDVSAKWLAERSPYPTDVTPTGYLNAVFEPWEFVFLCTSCDSSSPELFWTPGNTRSAPNIDRLMNKNEKGSWFLVNSFQQDSRRTDANLASFRYALLESDVAPRDLWLKMLVLLHLPVVSIVESGNKSVHALVKVDCWSKAEFDAKRVELIDQLGWTGADPASLTASRLSRLANVTRGDNQRVQRLLYLNPQTTSKPIFKVSSGAPLQV